MSQPLTGVVRRRLHDLSVHEGWFLLALADMVDSHTKEWRESWPKLTVRLGHRNQWCIKRLAYSLRDHNWLSVKSDGRGVIILLHPERGTPTPYRCSVVANQVSQLVANGVSHLVANRVGQQVANQVAGLDTPPITPSGANAPKRLSVARAKESGGAKDVTETKGPPLPPLSSEAEKAAMKNGHHPTLSPSERISIEQEINHLRVEINRILDVHYDRRDDDEKAKLREFKARVDLDCERIGRLPIYRKRT